MRNFYLTKLVEVKKKEQEEMDKAKSKQKNPSMGNSKFKPPTGKPSFSRRF